VEMGIARWVSIVSFHSLILRINLRKGRRDESGGDMISPAMGTLPIIDTFAGVSVCSVYIIDNIKLIKTIHTPRFVDDTNF